MNVPQIGSIKEGTLFVKIGMPGPWPLSAPLTIAEFKLTDGIAYLVTDPSGSLRVKVHDSEDRPALERIRFSPGHIRRQRSNLRIRFLGTDRWPVR